MLALSDVHVRRGMIADAPTPRVRISAKMIAVLRAAHAYGSEGWGDVWTHCSELFTRIANFERTAAALVRHGLVTEGDAVELTERGVLALHLDRIGKLRVSR